MLLLPVIQKKITGTYKKYKPFLTFYSKDTHFQQQTAFENIVGKEEIAHNEQFLLFPQCFLLNQITVSPLSIFLISLSLFFVEIEEPKIAVSGKGLKN